MKFRYSYICNRYAVYSILLCIMVFDDDKMFKIQEASHPSEYSFVRSGYNDIIILKLMVYYKYEYYVTLKD